MEASRAGKTAVLEHIKSQHESGLTWENPEEARELKYSNLIEIFLWAITEVEILGEEKELQQKSGVIRAIRCTVGILAERAIEIYVSLR